MHTLYNLLTLGMRGILEEKDLHAASTYNELLRGVAEDRRGRHGRILRYGRSRWQISCKIPKYKRQIDKESGLAREKDSAKQVAREQAVSNIRTIASISSGREVDCALQPERRSPYSVSMADK